LAGDLTADDNPDTFFELKVRPVLAGTCVKCHGALKVSGGLRLDSREAMLKGGESGPAVVPGDVSKSLLIQAIRHDDESLEMPPGKLLPEAIRADLAAWISAGAKWPSAGPAGQKIEGRKHWAFEPFDGAPPPGDATGWALAPIDRFIAASHRAHKLRPAPPADRRTLIRRAYFDLIGLPPDPRQVEAFLADLRPDAYERLVDELLASPQYGERWGRYWLDLARYADTAGDNSDYPIPQAYRYRNYVIDAFNTDVPYDRFLHEQLAGDILAADGPPEDYARRVIATGFIAQAKRFGTSNLDDIHLIIEDTLNTTGQVVLGLSLRCARCHDHKYDPITAREYYSLYGFFASTKYPFPGGEEETYPSGFAPLVRPDQAKPFEAKHAAEVARLKEELEREETKSDLALRVRDLSRALTEAEEREKTARAAAQPAAPSVDKLKADLETAKEQLATKLKPLRKQLASKQKGSPLPNDLLAYAVGEGKPTNVKIQKGGQPNVLGDLAPRGVLTCLDPHPSFTLPKDGSGRLELAHWLTTGQPGVLAARVMANRIWQHHFGKPIVPTPSDFGLRGTPPTHRELLDWLAREFIASGWSIKAMHRTIMLSKTYQLAAAIDPANAEIDTANTWYWRFDRRVLDAEALRDTLLDLAASLDRSRPGAHPFPAESTWKFSAHFQFSAVYPSSHRSIYLMVQRLHPHPYLAIFNGPDTSMSTPVRDSASVPSQALFLLNSPFVHDQARQFALRLIEERSDPLERLHLAYLWVYARPPSAEEDDRSLAYIRQYEQLLAEEGVAADRRSAESWSSLVRTLLASNEFVYVE
jgi:hypothetical protein